MRVIDAAPLHLPHGAAEMPEPLAPVTNTLFRRGQPSAFSPQSSLSKPSARADRIGTDQIDSPRFDA